jgi:hypothetical protein
VQALRVSGIPSWPLLRNLSYSGIGGAGNITANPVKFNPQIFSLICFSVKQVWEKLCLVICDDNVFRVESIHLMR